MPSVTIFDKQGYNLELRDYFAAQALPALIIKRFYSHSSKHGEEEIATLAYDMADAMLTVRPNGYDREDVT